MSTNARDTLGMPMTVPWLPEHEVDELRDFLEEVLQIPARAHGFSVTYRAGQPCVISVEFLPITGASDHGDL